MSSESKPMLQDVQDKVPTDSEQMRGATDDVKASAQSYGEKTMNALQQRRQQLNKNVVAPVRRAASQMQSRQPVLTAVLGIWMALSLVPVLTFVAYSLGCLAVVGGIALAITVTILSFLIGTAAVILGTVLFITFWIALIATGWIAAAWSAYRLLFCVTNEPSLPDALKRFRQELAVLLVGDRALPEGEHDAATKLGAVSKEA